MTQTTTGAPSEPNVEVWTDDTVGASMQIVDVPFVSVGGGLGSFAMVEYLRVAGMGVDDIRVVTRLARPHQTYEQLCQNSQIPRHERLRSDSPSTMDNIWGFPSYATREAVADRTLRPIWNVLVEPLFADYWTPRAGQVFESVEREAARIQWPRMLVKGSATRIRRRAGGGYFVTVVPEDGSSEVAYRCGFVHVAVGYPGLRFLPDLQEYVDRYDDRIRVVNAYSPHDHVYEDLKRDGGVVLLRGSGIVASRILQRLVEDRELHGADTHIIHLFRTYVAGPEGDSVFFRRPGGGGFAYQGFNFTRSAWGGGHREKLLAMDDPAQRAAFVRSIGGTNTASRRYWRGQLERGAAAGFYRQAVGEVRSIERTDGGRILTLIGVRDSGEEVSLEADYIIDATGLEGDPRDNKLLADLLENCGAGLNAMGRLDVDRTFEVRGARSEAGRVYASGAATLGGYYAPVDSFLGLQYAAQQICDDLAAAGAVPRIGVRRSVQQWWKWMRKETI